MNKTSPTKKGANPASVRSPAQIKGRSHYPRMLDGMLFDISFKNADEARRYLRSLN